MAVRPTTGSHRSGARKKGCPLIAERLGRDLATVITRASELNGAFDAWRKGEDKGAIVPGSVAWLRRLYERDEAFTDLAKSTQKDYSAKLDVLERFPLKSGRALSSLPAAAIERPHAKAMYRELKKRGPYLANAVMRIEPIQCLQRKRLEDRPLSLLEPQ